MEERFLRENLALHDLDSFDPEEILEQIMAEAEPCISIRTKPVQTTLLLGRSRFGGRPDLPLEVQWPFYQNRPLSFIGQINLSELPDFPKRNLLPKGGWLWFFYDAIEQAWGQVADMGSWQVIYAPPETQLHNVEFPESLDAEWGRFPHCELEFVPVLSFAERIPLGSPLETLMDEIDNSGIDAEELYRDVTESFRQPVLSGVTHQILGQAAEVQGSMFAELEEVTAEAFGWPKPPQIAWSNLAPKNTQGWLPLLQIGSDDNLDWMWGDLGCIYFWIRQADLSEIHFDRVWVLKQCG